MEIKDILSFYENVIPVIPGFDGILFYIFLIQFIIFMTAYIINRIIYAIQNKKGYEENGVLYTSLKVFFIYACLSPFIYTIIASTLVTQFHTELDLFVFGNFIALPPISLMMYFISKWVVK